MIKGPQEHVKDGLCYISNSEQGIGEVLQNQLN